MSAVNTFRRIAHRIPNDVVAIIESDIGLNSEVGPDNNLDHEMRMVERSLRHEPPKRVEDNSFAAFDLL